jgi:hypothetical protein
MQTNSTTNGITITGWGSGGGAVGALAKVGMVPRPNRTTRLTKAFFIAVTSGYPTGIDFTERTGKGKDDYRKSPM